MKVAGKARKLYSVRYACFQFAQTCDVKGKRFVVATNRMLRLKRIFENIEIPLIGVKINLFESFARNSPTYILKS